MKEQKSIPTGKVERASQFIRTGVKLGGNYVRHYVRSGILGSQDEAESRQILHEDNATDIYASLSELKGSALKVAQMMSMDRNIMPRAYQQRFAQAQYSAPPLSLPLVVRTFVRELGKRPDQLFEKFSDQAKHAASIGQVHEAWLGDKRLAVKVQYPGVADSIKADLRMVKPFATRILGLNAADVDRYTEEVEARLLEETDYELEARRSKEIARACAAIEGLRFPTYYPELSSRRILTMDWLEGAHLDAFLATDPSQEARDRAGQLLWDFYEYQVHELRQVHADPHPGNFLFGPGGDVGIIDFGCVKEIPDYFYHHYFGLINQNNLGDHELVDRIFRRLEFIYDQDTAADQAFFKEAFLGMIELLGRPFHAGTFDFGDEGYFAAVYEFSERLSRSPQIRSSKVARGSRDGLYINRTYYGLYSILSLLKARVRTHSRSQEIIVPDLGRPSSAA